MANLSTEGETKKTEVSPRRVEISLVPTAMEEETKGIEARETGDTKKTGANSSRRTEISLVPTAMAEETKGI